MLHAEALTGTHDGGHRLLSIDRCIEQLDAPGRIEEVARMLGGVRITATTRQHARELMEP